jgi:ADP-ribosyl-[dinitrogen reductase] hydrolase
MSTNKLMNSMIGAFVGDAAGATLEFYNRPITEEIAINAMSMPGGGAIRVGPGQITDDGELTIALWTALNTSISRDSNTLLLSAMKAYSDWYESCPFDIGCTCSMAFEEYNNFFQENTNTESITYFSDKIQDMLHLVSSVNKSSEANGALMRSTAIATWYAKNTDIIPTRGADFAKEDAKLSHPNIVCQEVNAIYVYAIIHLLRGKSPNETIHLLNNYVNTNITSEKVKRWYFQESLNIAPIDCTQQIGHVRWGFVLSIYFLRNPHISYEEAIMTTLIKGGDTDTNACIVGGMVGAYKAIPDHMKKPVLEYDCTKLYRVARQSHIRPINYSVKNMLNILL